MRFFLKIHVFLKKNLGPEYLTLFYIHVLSKRFLYVSSLGCSGQAFLRLNHSSMQLKLF